MTAKATEPVKAIRFMHKPLIITAYQVTLTNMEAVSEWCQGNIVPNDGKPFIRVPISRPMNVKQTEAHVGMWVTMSLRNGQPFCKVYETPWLDKDFIELGEGYNDVPLIEETITQVCCGGHTVSSSRTFPTQQSPVPKQQRPNPGNTAMQFRRN